jgi:myo-inositol-1(or 4)-monophosphatase
LIWALDPVDGTVNFVHGSPLCAISLGLITEDHSVLGVIDLPFLGTRYSVAEGNGAHANGEEITVSATDRIADAVVALGDYAVGDDSENKNRIRFALAQRLANKVQRIRMHGSVAIDLDWRAAGHIDAAIILGNKPWDTAAGAVIAREAGVSVVDLDGSPHTFGSRATIAANSKLISGILDIVAMSRVWH